MHEPKTGMHSRMVYGVWLLASTSDFANETVLIKERYERNLRSTISKKIKMHAQDIQIERER